MTKKRDSLLEIKPALDALPLFPLPHMVLFPSTMMALHVFEPRYKALVRDALSTNRTLAVVLIESDDAADDHGHPRIHRVAGVGTIVDHNELPGDRFNILLRGKARVTLEELPFIPPYRRARATVLEGNVADVPPGDVTALISTATAFASLVRERDQSFDFRVPSDLAPGEIADVCAAQLVVDARRRQTILEELDVAVRVRMVADALAEQHLNLRPSRRPPKGSVN